jgi:hypothetical protein
MYCSASRTAQSNTTQAITLEYVKWRCGPRASQMPSSGSRQIVSTCSMNIPQRRHTRLDPAQPLGADEHHPDDLAAHVELELLGAAFPPRTGLDAS